MNSTVIDELLTFGRLQKSTLPALERLARSMKVGLDDRDTFTLAEWRVVVMDRILLARRAELRRAES